MFTDGTFANEMWWGPIGVDAGRLVFHGVLDAHALWQMEPHSLGRPFGRLGDHLLDKRFGLVGLSEDLCVVRQAWCQFVEVGEFDVFQALGVEFATVAFGVREVVEDDDFLEVEGLCGGGLKGMDSADLTGLELVGVGHCGRCCCCDPGRSSNRVHTAVGVGNSNRLHTAVGVGVAIVQSLLV